MTALIDCRAPEACIQNLEKHDCAVITLPCADYLSAPVSGHTDMLVFVGFGKLFCHERYFEKNSELITRIAETGGLELVLSDEQTCDKYPWDVLFNCVTLGKYLLCNKNTASRLIISEAEKHGLEILHTNQGYTKCSVCKVSENAIITSDKSICDICTPHGIDCLIIPSGNVQLEGYDYGFIGGACGCDGQNIYFCGSLDNHPSGAKIKEFCEGHKKHVVCLSHYPLFDCGSVYFV